MAWGVCIGRAALLASATILLGGCVAAIPIASTYIARTVASAGTSSEVEVEFPSKDGKSAGPQALPPTKKVAVWPGDQREVLFAEKLQARGNFTAVATPTAVSAILAEARIPADMKQLTAQEQADAFALVCRRTGAGLVLGERQLGREPDKAALFSFSRNNKTGNAADLLAYSCEKHAVIWQDTMSLSAGLANISKLNPAGAEAWANRVQQAMGYSAVAAN